MSEIYCCLFCGRDTRDRSKICAWCLGYKTGGPMSCGHGYADRDYNDATRRLRERVKKMKGDDEG